MKTATKQYLIGYEEGFHSGWNAAVDSLPAQRKPLTDEQIVAKALHLSGLGTRPDVIQFARAIEAAHEGEHPEYIQGWNDCRAEMLKLRSKT